MHLNNIPKNLDSKLWKIKNYRIICNLLRMFWIFSWSSIRFLWHILATDFCNKCSIYFPIGSLENSTIVLYADVFSWNIYNTLKSVYLKIFQKSNFCWQFFLFIFNIVGSTSHMQENSFFIFFPIFTTFM